MKIYTDYPIQIHFNARTELPRFKYGCEVRTKILRRQLRKCLLIDIPHKVSDFTIERITKIKDGEIWHIGS